MAIDIEGKLEKKGYLRRGGGKWPQGSNKMKTERYTLGMAIS